MSTWRMAGLSYVDYSRVAAKILRHSLKSAHKEEALKRDHSHIRCFYWVEGTMLPHGVKPGLEKESAKT